MSQKLDKWLIQQFMGYNMILVNKFIVTFNEEGIVLVKDLVSLFKKKQLTYEYLKSEFGFKVGHFNRLIDSLNEIIIND